MLSCIDRIEEKGKWLKDSIDSVGKETVKYIFKNGILIF